MPTIERHAFHDEPPTRPIDNIPSATLARRESLRRRLYRAIDQAIDRDESVALATLDALLGATEGGQ